MTKNATSKAWTFSAKAPGGNYDSTNRDGEVVLNITGAGFGSPPTIAVYATLTDGDINSSVISSDPEIGSFTNLVSGYQTPKYYTMGDSSGMAGTEGGETTATNQRAGWEIVLPAFDTYFCSFQMGTPDFILGDATQRTFYGEATPRTLPAISTIKPVWLSDGSLDTAGLADIVLFTHVASWAIDGNDSAPSIGMGNDYDWDVWNSFSCHQKPGADPLVDNGITEAAITTPTAKTFEKVVTNQPTFSGVATAQYTTVNVQGWRGNGDQNLGMHLYRYFYFATGANARARIELGDNASYANCGQRVTVPHDTWSDTNVVSLPVDSKQRNGMTHYFITNASGTRQSGLIEDVT